MFNPACFAAPSVGANGNYIFPYIEGQCVLEPGPVALQELLDRRQGPEAAAADRGLQRAQPPDRDAASSTNLQLQFTNGVQSNPNFGKLGDDNKFGRRIVQLAVRYTF